MNPRNGFLYYVFDLLILPALWRIFRRAGFTPALSLVALVPFGLFIAGSILAFQPWPAEHREVR
jgi:hypothetical protein